MDQATQTDDSEFTTVAVRNGGGFVVSFFVEATAQDQPWSVKSGNYGSPETHTVHVPADATGITLTVHGESFIDDWKTILKTTWSDTSSWPTAGLTFSTSGSVGDMHCKPS